MFTISNEGKNKMVDLQNQRLLEQCHYGRNKTYLRLILAWINFDQNEGKNRTEKLTFFFFLTAGMYNLIKVVFGKEVVSFPWIVLYD